MVEMPTQSRGGVKGGIPLAGSRGSALCGVWGNAPTVPRATNSKGKANKGAGSKASLPVTLRFLRSAPKRLYSPLAHWRDHAAGLVDMACLFCKQRISPLRRRQGGFAVAPLTPSQCTPMRNAHPCFLILIVAGGFAPVGATRGQRWRYPFLKYSPLCCTIPSAFCTIAGRRCWVMSASITS